LYDILVAKLESPYSPPDSDGTPLGSPENRTYVGKEETRQANDVTKNNESPKSNEHGGNSGFLKHSCNSPDRYADMVYRQYVMQQNTIPQTVRVTLCQQ